MVTVQPLNHRAISRWSGAVLVVFILIGLSFGTWLSRLPAVRDALGASTFEMSIYGLCLAIGSVVGLLVSGYSVQWLGPRRALAVTIVAQAITLPTAVALILGSWIPLGLAVLFVYGFMLSTADVAMNVSGANAERALGRPRLPLMHAGYSLGAVGAMGLGAMAEAFGLAVELHFALVFGCIVIVALAVLPRLPRDEERARAGAEPVPALPSASASVPTNTAVDRLAPPSRRRYSPWRDPRILVAGAIAFAAGLLEGTPSDWLPLALVDGRGFTNENGAIMLGVFFASLMVVRLLGSVLLQRWGRVLVLRLSAVSATVGVVTVVAVPGAVAAVIGTIAWGLGTALVLPIAISSAADRAQHAVRGVAAVSAMGYVSMLVGPMGFGFLGEHIGLLSAFWVLLVFTALIGVLAGFMRESEAAHYRGRAPF